MGAKQNDLFASYGCSSCHDEVDNRTIKILNRELVKNWFYDGVIRTQQILIDKGIL